MHQLSPAQWLALVPTVAALTVSAQNATVPSMSIQSTAPSFRSAIQDYRPYTEEKTIDWKQANDNVGKIGGWREYAREASQPDTASGPDVRPANTEPKPDPKADPKAGSAKP